MCFFSSSSSSVSSSTSRICCSCCCYCCYNCRVVVLALLSSLMHALLHYTTTAIRNGWTWPIWNLSTWDLFWEEILQATFQTFEKKSHEKWQRILIRHQIPILFRLFSLNHLLWLMPFLNTLPPIYICGLAVITNIVVCEKCWGIPCLWSRIWV